MIQSIFYITAVFLVTTSTTACKSGMAASEDASVQSVTVCELAQWNQDMIGMQVRVRANYFTDFHHGAFLSDPHCPSKSLQIGTDAAEADKSVADLDATMGKNRKFYIGRKFSVDITGIFKWSKGKVINAELPPDRQLRVPPHAKISLLKVWTFEKPKQ
ncbi:MAG TPA: hypothetical protein VFG73_05620 [Rhodanobacteraceae bacterium]|nr:hypothetical protein [Rhodanobacteraceae bacterium]